MRVLLIPKVGDDVLEVARALLPEGVTLTTGDLKEGGPALAAKVKDADAIIGFIGRLPPEVWEVAPGRIKLIHTLVPAMTRSRSIGREQTGIPVCTNGGANAISVAEHTIMSCLRPIDAFPISSP